MLEKYSKKSSLEVIFKRSKMVFSKNDEVQEVICWGAGRNTHIYINFHFLDLSLLFNWQFFPAPLSFSSCTSTILCNDKNKPIIF